MTKIHSCHARGLLAGTAAVMLTILIGSAAAASELQGQQTVTNHQKLEQAWSSEGQPIPTTATVDGHYGVFTGWAAASDSALTVSGNHQSAEVAGNAASTTLTTKTVRAEGGGSYYDLTPFAVLSNRQTGDGTVKAISRMTVGVPGEISRSSVTLSDNASTALARINDAANGVTVDTVGLSGDVLLGSSQRAAGEITASASNRIGIGCRFPDRLVARHGRRQ